MDKIFWYGAFALVAVLAVLLVIVESVKTILVCIKTTIEFFERN